MWHFAVDSNEEMRIWGIECVLKVRKWERLRFGYPPKRKSVRKYMKAKLNFMAKKYTELAVFKETKFGFFYKTAEGIKIVNI